VGQPCSESQVNDNALSHTDTEATHRSELTIPPPRRRPARPSRMLQAWHQPCHLRRLCRALSCPPTCCRAAASFGASAVAGTWPTAQVQAPRVGEGQLAATLQPWQGLIWPARGQVWGSLKRPTLGRPQAGSTLRRTSAQAAPPPPPTHCWLRSDPAHLWTRHQALLVPKACSVRDRLRASVGPAATASATRVRAALTLLHTTDTPSVMSLTSLMAAGPSSVGRRAPSGPASGSGSGSSSSSGATLGTVNGQRLQANMQRMVATIDTERRHFRARDDQQVCVGVLLFSRRPVDGPHCRSTKGPHGLCFCVLV
jgi:hypothetical protein